MTPENVAKVKSDISNLREQLTELQRQRREARRKSPDSAQPNVAQSLANITRVVTRIAALENLLNSFDEDGEPISFCIGVQDKDVPVNSKLLNRGEFDQPDGIVERGFVQVLTNKKTRIKPNQSGRLELAKWMSSKKNPLTARVMANRIWQHLIGNGIVQTPENFGATGMRPTHPDLLDYLAIEFMNSKWSVKQMIRQIANSRSYRLSAKFDPTKYENDPANDFRWRANPRQLDAEALRDSMLMVSGSIDLERPRASVVAEAGMTLVRDGRIASFQPSMMSNDDSMSMGEQRRASRRQVKVYNVDEYKEFRSVYLPIVRNSLPRALEVFDFAEPGLVVGKRETSNTPSQGLYLLNNEFVMRQSRAMAERLVNEADTIKEQIELAFLRAYGRDATPDEVQAALSFHRNYEVQGQQRNRRRRGRKEVSAKVKKLAALTQAILVSAEFRYIN